MVRTLVSGLLALFLVGGQGVTLRNVRALGAREMRFPGAPTTMKMACGENPKRVYGERTQAPSTRMGNVAGYRAEWIAAQKYIDDWDSPRAAQASPNSGSSSTAFFRGSIGSDMCFPCSERYSPLR